MDRRRESHKLNDVVEFGARTHAWARDPQKTLSTGLYSNELSFTPSCCNDLCPSNMSFSLNPKKTCEETYVMQIS